MLRIDIETGLSRMEESQEGGDLSGLLQTPFCIPWPISCEQRVPLFCGNPSHSSAAALGVIEADTRACPVPATKGTGLYPAPSSDIGWATGQLAYFLLKLVWSPDFIALISMQLLPLPFGCMKLDKFAFGFDFDYLVGKWHFVQSLVSSFILWNLPNQNRSESPLPFWS